MSASGRPVVRTRLRPPVPHPDELRRSRLIARLETAVEPVVLVCGPRGSGKSVLLAQWIAARTDLRWCWVSLSRYEDSPAGFWSALLEALRALCPDVPAAPAALLDDPGVLLGDVVPHLLNTLADAEPLTVVLDGLDAVEDALTRASLDAFVPFLPDTVRLVLATARPPRGPIAALRAGGRLTEIDAEDLRLTLRETTWLLGTVVGRPVPGNQVAALHTALDGWSAGVRLTGLALRRGLPADGPLPWPVPGVVDYLRAEVLERVTSEQRHFLLQTSILDRLDPAVCAAVTGRDAVALLETLAGSSLLLGRTGRDGVLHYHPALRATSLAVLAAEQPDVVPELHARAAEALRRTGRPDAAVGHAVASGRAGLMAAAVRQDWPAAPSRVLLRRLERVPPAVIAADRGLRHLAAAAEVTVGDWAAAARWLGPPHGSLPGDGAARVLRALLDLRRGDIAAARAATEPAALDADTGEPAWRVLGSAVHGRALLWDGQPDRAWTLLVDAAAQARAAGYRTALIYALDAGALAAARLGQGAAAVRLALEAISAAGEDDRPPLLARCVLAEAAVASAAPDAAARIRAMEAVISGAEPHAEAYAETVLAEAARRAGDATGERLARTRATAALAGRAPGPVLGVLLAPSHRWERTPQPAGCVLSPREQAVLRALQGPLTIREIAGELHLSHNTVKTHVRVLFSKLGVHGRREAVASAAARGLLPPAASLPATRQQRP